MNTTIAAANAICARPFQTEEDFWKLRRLAQELYDLTGFSDVYKTYCWKKIWNTNESIPEAHS